MMVLCRVVRFVTLILAVSVLVGCASLPASHVGYPFRDSLDSFALEGRFSLRQEEKNYSGRLSWAHRRERSELLLASPFGQGLAEIVIEEAGARLTLSDGKVYAAADVETLTRDVLGYALPLGLMADWVRGQSGAGENRLDELGRLLQVHHGDWRIDYGYSDQNPASLPVRLIVHRGGEFELRLFIQEWNSLLSGE